MVRGVAHRGDPVLYPENTLPAFEAAVRKSYSHLELDVQLSKDGVPVICHDLSVNRTTDGTGRIKELTLAELKKLRIRGEGEIPTLEEALTLLKDQIIVNIELKQLGDYYPGLEQAALDVVRKLGMEEQVFFTSFDHYSVLRMREIDSEVELGLISHGASPAFFPLMKEHNMRYLAVQYPFLTPSYIETCEQLGIQLIAWTVDDEEPMRRIRQYPSLLICTNQLDRWAAIHRHPVSQ
ncbi:glycerophosphodiester phosphodiesterase family protein [Paenibacillus sp. J2TS4]|uniref:glycerophosphodiester phosphodiesterase n=1 Tax=Paenibacillus sp. J2TS4 TaxID=2807194 RepID=UPI001B064C9E|nr:glycerophosphodiester phosphodiesterase family protein [Paenibacillus sp. J2TS4]GIP33238.1 glycerophosphoryl diester phosphodiesterase [Paenibacillus sp. J2TS4]